MLGNDPNDKRCQAVARGLKSDLELFASGIIEVEDLKTSVDEAIKAYRSYSWGVDK
jgi:hypothetical protein